MKIRAQNLGAATLAPIVEIDPNDLAATGWGVLFAADGDAKRKAAIQEALKPLLDHRRSQAGPLFHIFDGPTGYTAGMTADEWLNARGSGLNVVDPNQGEPYYLMIAGSPDEIPFGFQYELDMFFAVGRLHFKGPEEFVRYAQNIVAYETGTPQHGNTIALFATRNDGDRATALLHDQVALQLAQGSATLRPLGQAQGYRITPKLADAATKRDLLDILRGNADGGPPALLFTGSHGVSFALSDPDQADKQGAILTQNWGGPGSPVAEDCFFTAGEVPSDAPA